MNQTEKQRKQTGKIIEEKKQPRRPSADEWINSVVHPHSGILLSYNRNEALTHATAWMHPEDSMQSERSQTQKATYCVIPLIDTGNVLSRQTHRDRT